MAWGSQLHDSCMWFDFKTMFDQITKCVEPAKKLKNNLMDFFVKYVYAFKSNIFIFIIREIFILYKYFQK
jgi:hypothetical protein